MPGRAASRHRFRCVVLGHSDPTSLIAVSALTKHPLQREMPALLAAEGNASDPTRHAALVASGQPVNVLSARTSGDLARNERWRDHLAKYGIRDELRAVFADPTGCWGYMDAYRVDARDSFSEDDAGLVRKVVRTLTSSLRLATVSEPLAARSAAQRQPAVLVLDNRLRIVARTGPAEEWLRVLRSSENEPLPCAMLAASARALAVAADDVSSARQRDSAGSWTVVKPLGWTLADWQSRSTMPLQPKFSASVSVRGAYRCASAR